MEMNDKIQALHRETFQRMLGIKGDLPDFLLAEYFKVKKLIDRVDGYVSPCDLAGIALHCGFDPETMTFKETEISPEALEKLSDDGVGTLTMSQTEIPPANAPANTGSPATEATEALTEPIKAPIIPYDTMVEILVDDVITEGKITRTQEDNGIRTYQVETEDGETYTVDEDEIDIQE